LGRQCRCRQPRQLPNKCRLAGSCFSQVDARRLLYRKAREKGIYAILAAPLAYGATLHIFDPKGMTFDEFSGSPMA
jgi:hypothetical protein